MFEAFQIPAIFPAVTYTSVVSASVPVTRTLQVPDWQSSQLISIWSGKQQVQDAQAVADFKEEKSLLLPLQT